MPKKMNEEINRKARNESHWTVIVFALKAQMNNNNNKINNNSFYYSISNHITHFMD